MADTFVLYHAHCPDGFGAALAAWMKHTQRATYLPVSYGHPPPDLPPYTKVYILDFSYSRAVLEALADNREVVVLDHHKSAQADLEGLPGIEQDTPNLRVHFDMEESGATLAWKFFHGGTFDAAAERRCPLFFKYLRDRDLWRWALPYSREVSLALWSYGQDFELWAHWAAVMETEVGITPLAREGKGIVRYADKLIAEQAHRAVWRFLDGYFVPVVNTTTLFSEVGDFLCQEHVTAPFAAYYFDRNDGKRQWGLRSRSGFDCSLVATQFGGGGHRGAAGFVTDLGWLPPTVQHEG